MPRPHKSTIRAVPLFAVFTLVVALLGPTACRPRGISETRASELFTQYVLDPIPKSVTKIRADQPKDILGYTYTFRFNINRTDLALLVESGTLQRVWNVRYENGSLDWGWDREGPGGLSMSKVYKVVYSRHSTLRQRAPAWFEPERWSNPEAYALEKKVGDRLNTQVLLYNEKEGEAYYITSSVRAN